MTVSGALNPLGATQFTARIGRFGGLLSLGIAWRRPRLSLSFLAMPQAGGAADDSDGIETVQAVPAGDSDHVSESVPATPVPRMDVGSTRSDEGGVAAPPLPDSTSTGRTNAGRSAAADARTHSETGGTHRSRAHTATLRLGALAGTPPPRPHVGSQSSRSGEHDHRQSAAATRLRSRSVRGSHADTASPPLNLQGHVSAVSSLDSGLSPRTSDSPDAQHSSARPLSLDRQRVSDDATAEGVQSAGRQRLANPDTERQSGSHAALGSDTDAATAERGSLGSRRRVWRPHRTARSDAGVARSRSTAGSPTTAVALKQRDSKTVNSSPESFGSDTAETPVAQTRHTVDPSAVQTPEDTGHSRTPVRPPVLRRSGPALSYVRQHESADGSSAGEVSGVRDVSDSQSVDLRSAVARSSLARPMSSAETATADTAGCNISHGSRHLGSRKSSRTYSQQYASPSDRRLGRSRSHSETETAVSGRSSSPDRVTTDARSLPGQGPADVWPRSAADQTVLDRDDRWRPRGRSNLRTVPDQQSETSTTTAERWSGSHVRPSVQPRPPAPTEAPAAHSLALSRPFRSTVTARPLERPSDGSRPHSQPLGSLPDRRGVDVGSVDGCGRIDRLRAAVTSGARSTVAPPRSHAGRDAASAPAGSSTHSVGPTLDRAERSRIGASETTVATPQEVGAATVSASRPPSARSRADGARWTSTAFDTRSVAAVDDSRSQSTADHTAPATETTPTSIPSLQRRASRRWSPTITTAATSPIRVGRTTATTSRSVRALTIRYGASPSSAGRSDRSPRTESRSRMGGAGVSPSLAVSSVGTCSSGALPPLPPAVSGAPATDGRPLGRPEPALTSLTSVNASGRDGRHVPSLGAPLESQRPSRPQSEAHVPAGSSVEGSAASSVGYTIDRQPTPDWPRESRSASRPSLSPRSTMGSRSRGPARTGTSVPAPARSPSVTPIVRLAERSPAGRDWATSDRAAAVRTAVSAGSPPSTAAETSGTLVDLLIDRSHVRSTASPVPTSVPEARFGRGSSEDRGPERTAGWPERTTGSVHRERMFAQPGGSAPVPTGSLGSSRAQPVESSPPGDAVSAPDIAGGSAIAEGTGPVVDIGDTATRGVGAGVPGQATEDVHADPGGSGRPERGQTAQAGTRRLRSETAPQSRQAVVRSPVHAHDRRLGGGATAAEARSTVSVRATAVSPRRDELVPLSRLSTQTRRPGFLLSVSRLSTRSAGSSAAVQSPPRVDRLSPEPGRWPVPSLRYDSADSHQAVAGTDPPLGVEQPPHRTGPLWPDIGRSTLPARDGLDRSAVRSQLARVGTVPVGQRRGQVSPADSVEGDRFRHGSTTASGSRPGSGDYERLSESRTGRTGSAGPHRPSFDSARRADAGRLNWSALPIKNVRISQTTSPESTASTAHRRRRSGATGVSLGGWRGSAATAVEPARSRSGSPKLSVNTHRNPQPTPSYSGEPGHRVQRQSWTPRELTVATRQPGATATARRPAGGQRTPIESPGQQPPTETPGQQPPTETAGQRSGVAGSPVVDDTAGPVSRPLLDAAGSDGRSIGPSPSRRTRPDASRSNRVSTMPVHSGSVGSTPATTSMVDRTRSITDRPAVDDGRHAAVSAASWRPGRGASAPDLSVSRLPQISLTARHGVAPVERSRSRHDEHAVPRSETPTPSAAGSPETAIARGDREDRRAAGGTPVTVASTRPSGGFLSDSGAPARRSADASDRSAVSGVSVSGATRSLSVSDLAESPQGSSNAVSAVSRPRSTPVSRTRDVRGLADSRQRTSKNPETITGKTNKYTRSQRKTEDTMDADVTTPSLTYRSEASAGTAAVSGEQVEPRRTQTSATPSRAGRSPPQMEDRGGRTGQQRRSAGGSQPDPQARQAGDSRAGSEPSPKGTVEADPRPSPSPFDDDRALEPTKRIDPTETPPGGDRAGRDRTNQSRRPDRVAGGGDVSLPDESGSLSMDADVDRVVDVLYRRLERKLRIERQRKGL